MMLPDKPEDIKQLFDHIRQEFDWLIEITKDNAFDIDFRTELKIGLLETFEEMERIVLLYGEGTT